MDIRCASARMYDVTAIRVIFDGKAFIPQQPVSLPDQSEAMVLVEQSDSRAQAQLDAALRAYYQGAQDADDDASDPGFTTAAPFAPITYDLISDSPEPC